MLGIDINKIIKTITDFEPVNGRMNIIKSNDITYVVDFAHTPKAFESLLTFASSVK
jgi:UDP-N-acetylmuramyl tripeptide synthase